MAEFLNEHQIQTVASTEYPAAVRKLDDLDAVAAIFETLPVLEQRNYRALVKFLRDLEADALKVVQKIISNGISVEDTQPFINYVHKRADRAMQPLANKQVTYDASKPPTPLCSLALAQFLSQKLELQARLIKATKDGTPIGDHKNDYLMVKYEPAAIILPEIQADLAAVVATYPGIIDDHPPLADQAVLDPAARSVTYKDGSGATKTENETEQQSILRLVQDWLSEDASRKFDTRWISNSNEVLLNYLKATQQYGDLSGTAPAHPEVIEKKDRLLQLRQVLGDLQRRAVEEAKEAKYSGLPPDAAYTQYGLTEARVKELIAVLDMIIEIKNTPPVQAWRNSLHDGIRIYTNPAGERISQFIERIKHKQKINDTLTDDDTRDIIAARQLLAQRRSAIPLLQLPDASGGKYMTELLQAYDAEVEELEQELDEITLKTKIDKGAEADTSEESFKAAMQVYKFLRSENPRLPEIRQPRDLEQYEYLDFMREVELAIYMYLERQVFTKAINSASTGVFEVPGAGGVGNLLETKFTDVDEHKKTDFDIFFRYFPFTFLKDVPVTEEKRIRDEWELRLIAFSTVFNKAAAVRQALLDKGEAGGLAAMGAYNSAFGTGEGKSNDPTSSPFDSWVISATHKEGFGGFQFLVPQIGLLYRQLFRTRLGDINETKDPDIRGKLQAVKDEGERIIFSSPKYGEKRPDGSYVYAAAVTLGYKYALSWYVASGEWYTHDKGGIATKLIEFFGYNEVMAKYLDPDTPNTLKKLPASASEVGMLIPPRSEGVHLIVHIPASQVEVLSTQQVIDEIYRLDRSPNPVDKKNASFLRKEVNDARRNSVLPGQDLTGLSSFEDAEQVIQALTNYADRQDSLGGDPSTPPQAKLVHKYLANTYRAYVTKLQQAFSRIKADPTYPTSEEKRARLIFESGNFSADTQYRFIRMKPSARVLADVNTDSVYSMPVAVPNSAFHLARSLGKPGSEMLLSLPMRTVEMLGVHPNYYGPDASQYQNTAYAGMLKNIEYFFETISPNPSSGIRSLLKAKGFRRRAYSEEQLARDMKARAKILLEANNLIRFELGLPERIRKYEEGERKKGTSEDEIKRGAARLKAEVDNRYEEHARALFEELYDDNHHGLVGVYEIKQDDIFKGTSGEGDSQVARVNLGYVTQGVRYYLGPLFSLGALHPGAGKAVPSTELLRKVLNTSYEDELGFFGDLIGRGVGQSEMKRVLTAAAAEPHFALVAGAVGYGEGGSEYISADLALNTALYIFSLQYLQHFMDKFRPKPNEGQRMLALLTDDDVDHYAEKVKTVMDQEPLKPEEIAAFIEVCKVVSYVFRTSTEFGADKGIGPVSVDDGITMAYKILQKAGIFRGRQGYLIMLSHYVDILEDAGKHHDGKNKKH